MIDHVSLQVTDVARSKAFYQTVLLPLGLRPDYTDGAWTGFANSESAPFWIGPSEEGQLRELHIAFKADRRSAVREFHAAAAAVGAEILHAPQIFPEYDPGYFECFVRDPDGHNIEAVCRLPEAEAR